MFGWIRRAVDVAEVRRRVEEVELDIAALQKQIEKLRGRATGGIRHRNGGDADAEPDPPGMPPNLDPISRRIWLRRLKGGKDGLQVHG